VDYKRRRTITGKISFILIAIALLLSFAAFSVTEQGENFKLTLTGSKTWTLSYGIGDASGLARAGASSYQLSLDQSLAVDIVGEALSVLTIELTSTTKSRQVCRR